MTKQTYVGTLAAALVASFPVAAAQASPNGNQYGNPISGNIGAQAAGYFQVYQEMRYRECMVKTFAGERPVAGSPIRRSDWKTRLLLEVPGTRVVEAIYERL